MLQSIVRHPKTGPWKLGKESAGALSQRQIQVPTEFRGMVSWQATVSTDKQQGHSQYPSHSHAQGARVSIVRQLA